MNSTRKVASNTLIQIIGRVVGLVITLITVNYIANHLIVNGSLVIGYGQYTTVFTYITILGAAADLGLFTLIVREIAGKGADEGGQLIGAGLTFRFILCLAVFGLFLGIYHFLPYAPAVQKSVLLGVLVAFLMLFSQTISTTFQSNLLSERIVVAETLGKIIIMILTIVVLRAGYGLLPVIAVNVVGQALTLIIYWLFARGLIRLRFGLDRRIWSYLSGQFWSVALVNVLALVHFKSDSLLLTFFRPVNEVGIYGVAYKVLEVVLIIPSIFATNLLPILSLVLRGKDPDKASLILGRSSTTLLILSAYIILLLVILSPWIVVFITQRAFLAAELPLRILSLSLLFSFLTTLFSQAVIAAREQQSLVKGYLLAILLNIGLNLYIIPRYSYVGAATTTVITEGILMIYTYLVMQQKLNFRLEGKVIWRVLGASIGTGIIVEEVLRLVNPIWRSLTASHGQIFLFLIGSGSVLSVVFLVTLLIAFSGQTRRLRSLLDLT